MNRLILIGNGFDLAHGLKTSYNDFINWYWEERVHDLKLEHGKISEDCLCSFGIKKDWESWHDFFYLKRNRYSATPEQIIGDIIKDEDTFEVNLSPFFQRINNNVRIKGWVDIENDYYSMLCSIAVNNELDDYKKADEVKELNKELDFIKSKLLKYLHFVTGYYKPIKEKIKQQMFANIRPEEVTVSSRAFLDAFTEERKNSLIKNGGELLSSYYDSDKIKKELVPMIELIMKHEKTITNYEMACIFSGIGVFVPDRIMFLNFNYTNIASFYIPQGSRFMLNHIPRFILNHIHGELSSKNDIIFGYGDELDETYPILLRKNDNEYLEEMKSVHYMESNYYKTLMEYIESAPYQIYIFGHSCGNSDRTLLNTLFEHKNCVSIKPFYYKKDDGTDNYNEIVKNIIRNFTDMKTMRDRVVNKKYCEPLGDESPWFYDINKRIQDSDSD